MLFCPFLSCGKSTVVECRQDCALYNGTADGALKECVLFSIGKSTNNAVGLLKDIEENTDATATEASLEVGLSSRVTVFCCAHC